MYSKTFAYLLWFLSGFGCLGFHRFYLRKPFTGILMACTAGFFGLGSVYDLLTLGTQVDKANMQAAGYHAPFPMSGTRYANDAKARIIRDKETTEQAVLRLAKQNKGIVTAAFLALETGITLDEAKKQLDILTAKGHIDMRVRHNGDIVFTVNDFLQDENDFEV
ncbi:MAG: TM2 domain-containing protein [Spirochaetaceae bacterium]|jgi:TM2 domain-containing membrane protein YozV|nr:TM2 domain-containing protein [Spirochaetaceae bacterium]